MYFVLALLFFGRGGAGGAILFWIFLHQQWGWGGPLLISPENVSQYHRLLLKVAQLFFNLFLSPLWLTMKDQVTIPVKESTSEGIRITIAINMQVNAVTLFKSSRKWQYCDRSTHCIHFHVITWCSWWWWSYHLYVSIQCQEHIVM